MSELNISQATEYAIELLGKSGGVAVGEVSDSANLRWANSSLTTNGNAIEQSLAIAAFVAVQGGTACGVASGQIRNKDDVERLVEKSKASAVAAGVAEDANELVTGNATTAFHNSPASTDLTQLQRLSADLGQVMKNGSAGYFGFSEITTDTIYLATSGGIRQRFEQSSSRFELCAKSTDRTKSSWSGQSGTSLNQVDVTKHAAIVDQGLNFQNHKIDVEPGKHNVTLSPSAVADLMIYLMWTASAREAAEGRSVFSSHGGGTRVGEQLTNRKFSLLTDPKYQGLETLDRVISMGSSSFGSTFDTGLEIKPVELISNGRLSALGSNRFTADLAKLPFTPLADNIIVTDADGHGDLSDTAARMNDGLLITCLWYIREVDPQSLLLTGLTRDGVYVVKNGEIIGAANNFRFNESPVGMLNRIVDAGQSTYCLPREWADYFGRAKVAPLTIADFNLSTRSDAIQASSKRKPTFIPTCT